MHVRQLNRGASVVAVGAILAMMSGGCRSTTPSGTSYILKVDRELRSYLDANLAHTHETARRLLEEEFRFMIIDEGLDGREGFMEARSAKGRYVRIETYLVDFNTTEVEIYVTPFGYQPLQVDILTSLGERLGVTPKATVEPSP